MLNHPYMLQDAPFTLLAGGLHHCDPAWNKLSNGLDQCCKLYCLVSGQARLKLETQDVLLRSNHAYLIPGYRLVHQECPRRMDVYWVHFVPKSLHMMMWLSHMEKVYQWNRDSMEYWQATWEEIPRLFENGCRGPFYRVQAMLLDIASQFLDSYDPYYAFDIDPVFEQLKPAIAFMDQHIMNNPRLEEVAKVVHLAPNYFHRKFTGAFHITPFNYMLKRRLDLGRQLLLNTDLTLQSIAKRCGFYSEFHFSKMFKKHCSLSPRQFRKRTMP